MRRSRTAALAALLASVTALPIHGQAPAESGSFEPSVTSLACAFVKDDIVCEEIIVTRKRVESIDDIPRSVELVSGTALRNQGRFDLSTLSGVITNLHYSANVGPSDNIVMRGLGTVGAGPQFEPAVGQLFNGVFLGRSRFGRTPWFDLRQVEVFRGPQGVVIGRNHSLGAVSAIPNTPTSQFFASAFSRYTVTNSPGVETEGVLSGPVTERINMRLAVRATNRDGWYDNNYDFVRAPERDDKAVRLMADVELGVATQMELLWQRLDIEHLGKPREIVFCSKRSPVEGDTVFTPIGGNHPEFNDCVGNLLHHSAVAQRPEPWNTVVNLSTMRLTHEIGTGQIDVVVGIMDYQMDDVVDADLDPDVPAQLRDWPRILPRENTLANGEAYDQRSIEVRYNGVLGSETDYIVGVNYLVYGIEYWQDHSFENFRPPRDSSMCPAHPFCDGFNNGTARHIHADVDDDSLGLFFDINRQLRQNLVLNVGVRALRERKDAMTSRRAYEVGTALSSLMSQRMLNDADPECLEKRGFFLCSDVDDDRRDTAVTYNTSLQWNASETTRVFGAIATGWKSGGFNLTADQSDKALEYNEHELFNFDPEKTISFEIGGRHDIGEVGVNWTLFRTVVNDLQVSSFTPGSITHATHNDASAESRGLELAVDYVQDHLVLRLSGAYTDAVYRRFDEAPCYFGQQPHEGCAPKLGGDNPNSTQNLTGRQLARAPRLQAVADIIYTIPVGTRHVISWAGKVVGSSRYSIDTELRPIPEATQRGFAKYDASVRIGDFTNRWSITLAAQNLTDKRTYNFFNEIGLLAPYVGVGSAFAYGDPSRTVSLALQYRTGGDA